SSPVASRRPGNTARAFLPGDIQSYRSDGGWSREIPDRPDHAAGAPPTARQRPANAEEQPGGGTGADSLRTAPSSGSAEGHADRMWPNRYSQRDTSPRVILSSAPRARVEFFSFFHPLWWILKFHQPPRPVISTE